MVKVLCVTGLPGSGKGVVCEVAKELNIPCFTMGDDVREEARRRGIPLTSDNLNKLATELREVEGPDAIARRTYLRIVDKLRISQVKLIVIDGVRSLHEVEYFKRKLGDVRIVAVHASPTTRYRRILERSRPGDPKNWDEFRRRDITELSWGIGEVIALADYMIVNEGDLESIKREVRRLLEEILNDPHNCKS